MRCILYVVLTAYAHKRCCSVIRACRQSNVEADVRDILVYSTMRRPRKKEDEDEALHCIARMLQ